MKKFSIFLASLLTGVAAIAQTQPVENPNRLIMTDAAQTTKAYVLDRVSELSFARVEGDVKADVQVLSATTEGIKLNVQRSEACMSFKITAIPYATAAQLTNPAAAINYINNRCKYATCYEDFDGGMLSGMELSAGGDYAVMTIGIDEYGAEVDVCSARFSVPAAPVVGDPKVECTLVDAQLESFTVSFKPNSDVTSYYCVAADKGSIERQYIQFGPMYGFTSMADLIRAWGVERQGDTENTWKNMAPNTEYEVFVLALDANGNPAPYQVFNCTTLSLGGDGEAKVTITPGDYKLTDWGGQMLPSQFFTFTPNDQAASYRFGVYTKEQYDKEREVIRAQLCSEPPVPDLANWFFYTELTTDFQVNPNTAIVAIAAAKNIKGEWGPVTEVELTTPAEAAAAAPAAKRPVPQRRAFRPGYVPSFGMGGKVSLTH